MSPVNALRGSQIAMRHELHKDVRAHRGSAKRGKVYIHIGLNPLDSIGNVIICEYLCFFWILPLVFLVIIISIYLYIYIYQWCINPYINGCVSIMSTMHWLEVWRMWKFLGSSAWQRWENVPFLLKRASFDTRLFWAISGPNMFFTTLFCANGGSQSASVHRMVPYTITWSTMINIYRDFGLKGFPMEFESRDRNSWTICLVVLTILKNMSSSMGRMTSHIWNGK